MKHPPSQSNGKPYDLRARLLLFACDIARMAKFLQTRGPIAVALCPQVLKSGTSAAANYEEADDASSGRDALEKTRIALRELKETRVRLQVLRGSDILPESYDALLAENTELVKIVATIIRKKSGGTSSR